MFIQPIEAKEVKYDENVVVNKSNTKIVFCILAFLGSILVILLLIVTVLVLLEKILFKSGMVNSLSFIKLNEANRSLPIFNQSILPSKSELINISRQKFGCQFGFSGPNCEDECGITIFTPNVRRLGERLNYASAASRILGGYEAWPHSWPSIVLIVFNYRIEIEMPTPNQAFKQPHVVSIVRTFVCAGTLVGRKTVLTAAHCIIKTIEYNFNSTKYTILVVPNAYFPTMESMYQVYMGVHDKSTAIKLPSVMMPSSSSSWSSTTSTPDPWNSQMSQVKRIRVHPNFDASSKLNDLAIVILDSEFEMSPNMQTACLPAASEINGLNEAWIVGWGSLFEGGPMTNWLRNTRINVYDGTYCENVVKEFPKNWSTQLCAGDLNGAHDSCQGDSGGPLYGRVQIDGHYKYFIAGIVSYGEGCGEPNKPGIYTKISAYLNWIYAYLDT